MPEAVIEAIYLLHERSAEEIVAKLKPESLRLIKNSSLDWTIVRPGVLTSGRRTGRYNILDKPSQWRNGMISRSDVAEFLVRQIEDRTYVRKAPVLIYC